MLPATWPPSYSGWQPGPERSHRGASGKAPRHLGPDDRGAGSAGQLNSPARIPTVNAAHSVEANVRIGPARSLLSRTARCPLGSSAISTQLPAAVLRDDFRKVAPARAARGATRVSFMVTTPSSRCGAGRGTPSAGV